MLKSFNRAYANMIASKRVSRIEAEEPALRLAVLIDADNAQAAVIEGILGEVARFGEATVKRIYGDFTSPCSASWKKVLQKYAIKPVQPFAYSTGKSATDSTLIIDAMDLLYTRRFDGFCLVTSDSDFTGLATRIREEGADGAGLWGAEDAGCVPECLQQVRTYGSAAACASGDHTGNGQARARCGACTTARNCSIPGRGAQHSAGFHAFRA
ncbi:NYN domain-containing protein [Paraburkholderia sp. BL17N1]|uniref:NYN domain-containing protein n=1 Tax=Paraburkholderia sp. BL17N1 TaxID=1938798 RepID=UPI001F540287|nr:NYN domain-containing protein [Paraburkholderia sp. BL17N1]